MEGRTLILFFFSCLGSFSVEAQLSFDSSLSADILEEVFVRAEVEKDSADLGMAALLLAKKQGGFPKENLKHVDLLYLAIDCFDTVEDSLNYYRARLNLQFVHLSTNDYESAKRLGVQNLTYFKKIENLHLQLHTLTSLSRAYEKSGEPQKANFYLRESLRLNQTVKDTLIEVLTYARLIPDMIDNAQPDSGLIAARRMYDLAEHTIRKDMKGLAAYYSGLLMRKKNNADSAVFYLKRAEEIYKRENSFYLESFVPETLSEIYEERGDLKQALEYARQYNRVQKALYEKKEAEALEQLSLKYQTKEKEEAISRLERETAAAASESRRKNYFLLALSLASIVLLTSLGLLYRFYREQRRKDGIIAQQKQDLDKQRISALENELQLTTAQAMLDGQEKERARISRDLHDSLGGLLSAVKLNLQSDISKANYLLDKAVHEIRLVTQNFQPFALGQKSLGDAVRDLVYLYQRENELPKIIFQQYNVPADLPDKAALQLYRIIQEALNNALKHAEATEILIQLNGEPDGLSVMIEDNGKGFDTAEVYAGTGLKNFRKRAGFLTAELKIDSDREGTTVYIFWEKS